MNEADPGALGQMGAPCPRPNDPTTSTLHPNDSPRLAVDPGVSTQGPETETTRDMTQTELMRARGLVSPFFGYAQYAPTYVSFMDVFCEIECWCFFCLMSC